jgi:hypothetical protein
MEQPVRPPAATGASHSCGSSTTDESGPVKVDGSRTIIPCGVHTSATIVAAGCKGGTAHVRGTIGGAVKLQPIEIAGQIA